MKVGDRVPSAKFKMLGEGGLKDVTSDELFKGKKVVVFALPGAFTPTCSAKHLPGFVQQAAKIKAKGVNTIACISVNDAFVMDAWGKQQSVGNNVLMLSDGNAEFTRAMGLEMDASGYGMGVRSQRYAMVVEDGVIKHLAVEKPGEFTVSSAESVLAAL